MRPRAIWPRVDLGRAPAWLVACVCALIVAPSAWRAARPLPEDAPEQRRPPRDTAKPLEAGAAAPDYPAALWTASLRAELFPQAVAEPPPPPPPPLQIELVAVTRDRSGLRAFVFDAQAGAFATLAVGQRSPSGAVLTALDDRAATFDRDGRTARAELKP